jgi:hypothetical protein
MIAPQVCDFTTVEAIGKMKIQFWKDTIEDIYSKVQYQMMVGSNDVLTKSTKLMMLFRSFLIRKFV